MLSNSILTIMLVQVVCLDNFWVYGHTLHVVTVGKDVTYILGFFSYTFCFPVNKQP